MTIPHCQGQKEDAPVRLPFSRCQRCNKLSRVLEGVQATGSVEARAGPWPQHSLQAAGSRMAATIRR